MTHINPAPFSFSTTTDISRQQVEVVARTKRNLYHFLTTEVDYILPPIGEDMPPLPEAVAALKDALTEARAAEDHLRTVLTKGGWLND